MQQIHRNLLISIFKITPIAFGEELSEHIIDIHALQIGIDINKTDELFQNSAGIKIWNLSEIQRDLIRNRQNRVFVKFAWGLNPKPGDFSTLYEGNVLFVNKVVEAPDEITEIWCGTEINQGQKGFISRAFDGGTDLREIINSYGFSSINFLNNDANVVLEDDFYAEGTAQAVLNRFALENNLLIYFDDDTVVIDTLDAEPAPRVIRTINSNNGLLGKPTINELGLNISLLIDPQLRLSDYVNVELRSHFQGFTAGGQPVATENAQGQGVFRIVGLKHAGTNRDGMLITTLTLLDDKRLLLGIVQND